MVEWNQNNNGSSASHNGVGYGGGVGGGGSNKIQPEAVGREILIEQIAETLNRLPEFRVEYAGGGVWAVKTNAIYGGGIHWKQFEIFGERDELPISVVAKAFLEIAMPDVFVAFREGPDWWYARYVTTEMAWEIFLRDETPLERAEWAKVVQPWKRPDFEGWPGENSASGVKTSSGTVCRICQRGSLAAPIVCDDGFDHVWS